MATHSFALASAAFTGLTVVGLLGPRRRGMHRLGASSSGRPGSGRRRVVRAAAGAAIGGPVVMALAGVRVMVCCLVVAAVVAVGVRLRSSGRGRVAAARCRGRVIEACGVLAADLRAGRPPQEALDGAATVCPELGPAAAASRLGGDVGLALDRSAAAAGAEGLRSLGAGWRVAERSGSALAGIADRIAESLRAEDAVRRQVSASLSGTRSTARLLAALPFLGTALGYAVGADPLAFLLGSPFGWLCLALGLTLATLGLTWMEHLTTTPDRPP